MTITNALLLLGQALLSVWGLWYLYVLVMGFYRAKLAGKLTVVAFTLAMPAIFIGFLVDLLTNWSIASLWFREWPRRPLELVTDRLTRYQANGPGWRHDNAAWICANLLDYFDPHDTHCG